MDIFNALAAKYIQVPLLFPIQTIQIKDFTNELQKSNDGKEVVHITTANTLALKHCDALFAVFRNGEYARTCFENPFISYQFNIDGKLYPREQCNSYEDARCLNNTFDALNINNSLIKLISKDLRTSLQPYSSLYVADEDGALTEIHHWSLGDYSNFMIGIPLADSEDFMGGISTSGTVQIELVGDRKFFTNIPYRVTAICFEDKLLKI